jgi:hypothetical protein
MGLCRILVSLWAESGRGSDSFRRKEAGLRKGGLTRGSKYLAKGYLSLARFILVDIWRSFSYPY